MFAYHIGIRNLVDVSSCRESSIAFLYTKQSGRVPNHIDCLGINGPSESLVIRKCPCIKTYMPPAPAAIVTLASLEYLHIDMLKSFPLTNSQRITRIKQRDTRHRFRNITHHPSLIHTRKRRSRRRCADGVPHCHSIIIKYSSNIRLVAVAAAAVLRAEPVVGGGCGSGDDNVVTLADGEEEPSGVEGDYWDEVRCDDGENMGVEGDIPAAVDGCVY
jgi:hypothetical protein